MAKITIKIKGAEASRQVAAGKLHVIAGKAAKGGAVGFTKLGKGGGLLAHGAHGKLGLQGNLGSHAAAVQQVPVTKAFGASALKLGAGGATTQGTIWTGTGNSLGLGVGLGVAGPILLITALGLVATGIYIYIRSQSVQRGGDEGVHSES